MNKLLVICFLVTTPAIFAQKKDSTSSYVPAFIVKIAHTGIGAVPLRFSNDEWNKMTPGFTVPDSLKNDFSFGRVMNNNLSALFTFSLINNKEKQAGKKFRTTTTFHLGIGPQLDAQKTWSNTQIQVVDTLTSSVTGTTYLVNETRTRSVGRRYQSNSLMLGIDQHFATNPNRKFQFETGLDALYFMSMNSAVYTSVSESVYYDNPFNAVPAPIEDMYQYEKHKGTFVSGLILRVPLDMSFYLSRKSEVCKRMRIGFELNPGLAMQFGKVAIRPAFNISGGVNFRFQI